MMLTYVFRRHSFGIEDRAKCVVPITCQTMRPSDVKEVSYSALDWDRVSTEWQIGIQNCL
jgi:hypothetical protein